MPRPSPSPIITAMAPRGPTSGRAASERTDDWSAGRIDAIFAPTGIVTFRAYEALAATGLRVPEDIAILGLDDFAWAEHLAVPLSVIVQPTAQMGDAAARVILDEPGESQHITFPPSLVVRGSTTL